MKKLFLLLLIAHCSLLIAFGQAPNNFKYQAVVRDISGNLIMNQSVTFRLSILKTSASGTISYREEQTTTTNQFGLANLTVGNGINKTGSIDTIGWGNAQYFLKIEYKTGSNPYQVMGTSQLLSVPYALYAGKSGPTGVTGQTLRNDGKSWIADNFLFNTGTHIGIGNTIPTAALHLISTSSSTTTTPLYPGPTHVGSFSDMSNGDGNTNIGMYGYGHGGTYWDNGLVGVANSDASANNGITAFVYPSKNKSFNAAIYAVRGGTTKGYDFAGYFRGDVELTEGKFKLNDGTQGFGKILTSDSDGVASWINSSNSNLWSLYGNTGTTAGTNFLGTTDANDLVFKTNNTEYMRLTQGGKIGIGYTTPTAAMQVVSTSSTLTAVPTITNAMVGIYGDMSYNSSYPNIAICGYGHDGTGFNVGLTGICNSTATYNYGIYANAPANTTGKGLNCGIISFSGTNGTGFDYAGYFDGDVFIAHALKANGKVTISDGTQAAGSVLTSDANGLASWQAPNSTTVTSVGLSYGQSVASVSTTPTSMTSPIATFTKNNANTRVEVTFQTHIYVTDLVGATGVDYELRIDGAAAGNNAGRTGYFTDNNGATTLANYNQVTMYAVFTGLAAGSHNVQLWVWTPNGSATNAWYNYGNWGTTNVTIKEIW